MTDSEKIVVSTAATAVSIYYDYYRTALQFKWVYSGLVFWGNFISK